MNCHHYRQFIHGGLVHTANIGLNHIHFTFLPAKQIPLGLPAGSLTTRQEHCAHNPSGKDQLYPDEIKEIAEQHFSKLDGMPCRAPLGFGAYGKKYDHLIAGWVQYWNEVLQPDLPLEAEKAALRII